MSLNHQQAGRDAADFDTNRHSSQFAHYRSPSEFGFCPVGENDKIQAVLDALAQIERCFGRPSSRHVQS